MMRIVAGRYIDTPTPRGNDGAITPLIITFEMVATMAATSTIVNGVLRFTPLWDSSEKNRSGFVRTFAISITSFVQTGLLIDLYEIM